MKSFVKLLILLLTVSVASWVGLWAEQETQEFYIEVPYFWEIGLHNLALPLITLIAGLLDWFNPCALFILLFLLSVLLNSNNKKKLIILWSTFIIASGIAYLWILSFLLFTMQSIPQHYRFYLQVFVGLLAIGFWVASLIKFWYEKSGCTVMWESKRNFFFNKIKKAIESKSMIISMVWITLIAFAINFFEMFCTAWIPITYVAILEAQWYWWWTNMLYLLWYIFFFLLDHFLIFGVAVATFSLIWISTKYKKWISLAAWILMVVLWIIMLLRPELIMFW